MRLGCGSGRLAASAITDRPMLKTDTFAPPKAAQAAAARGVALRSEFGRGGTSVGAGTARSLINGTPMGLDKLKQMNAFFIRHEKDKREGWSDASKPTNGYIAHLLWGGDAAKSWAIGIRARAIKAGVWYG